MDIEWLILADAAQVIGNKLNLLGGGWDVLTVNSEFPVNQRCSLALAVRVPWNETNQKHSFEVEVLSEDASTEQHRTLMKAGGEFEVGRPAGIPVGQNQRVQLAVDMTLKFDEPGTNVIVARIGGAEMKRTHFNVVAGPRLASQQRQ